MNAQPARPFTVVTDVGAANDGAAAPAAQSLAHLHKGMRGRVIRVIEPAGLAAQAGAHNGAVTIGDATGSTIARRLVELGFVPGEAIEIIEEVRPGGDPIAVRIGATIFALRRREAQAVMVQVDQVEPVT